MNITINVKELRASLPKVVEGVRKGARYTVIYRGQPAFQIVPIGQADASDTLSEAEQLNLAPAVGCSTDDLTVIDTDIAVHGE